jgi:ketosteroid isomerase-like protein
MLCLQPNGPSLEGRAAIRTWVTAFTGMTTFTAMPEEIEGSDGVAYARGTYALTMSPTAKMQGSDAGKWITIYQKQADGSWRIRRNIWNSNSPLPK